MDDVAFDLTQYLGETSSYDKKASLEERRPMIKRYLWRNVGLKAG